MKFDQPHTLRQSMSWLHTWSGLLLGWLMFAIFVTGTLSFFRNEITLWMQPEVHLAKPDSRGLTRAIEYLQQHAAQAPQWSITLPNARSPLLNLSWRKAESSPMQTRRGDGALQTESRSMERSGNPTHPTHQSEQEHGGTVDARPDAPQRARRGSGRSGMDNGAEHAPQDMHQGNQTREATPQAPANASQSGGGRQGMQNVQMDPASGEILQPRQTAGGNFLYRFHFELYGLERAQARWVVGIATFCMLVAIVSGVIIHRNIFKDFFTFRPGKGKRSWMDGHNLTSVLALPFHIVITFSGLILLGAQLMPSVIQASYDGDTRAMMQEMRNRNMSPQIPPSGHHAPMTDLAPLLAQAAQQWPSYGIGSIAISNPGDANSVIEIRQALPERLDNRAMAERMRFDGVTGQLLESPPPVDPVSTTALWNALTAIHLGHFAFPLARWLLFLCGAMGSVMVASGLAMWVIARSKPATTPARRPFGHRLVEVLNVAGVAGLLVAIAAYFWANRLIPAGLSERNLWEIRIFFTVWLLTLVHAGIRRHKAAWVEQLSLAGGLSLLLPVVNGLSGGLHLGQSVLVGAWQVAGFDLCALAVGSMLLFGARQVQRHQPRIALNAKSTAKPAPGMTEGVTVSPRLKTEEA